MESPSPVSAAPCVGVDVGASGVRAWRVHAVGRAPLRLAVRGPACEADFGSNPFEPRTLALQLEELRAGGPRPAEAERAEARRRLELCAGAIARAAQGESVAVALAAPGLRAADGRGLVAARNGPRMPHFLDDLEAALAARGVRLSRALPALVGDGEAAGWGELLATDGTLADARAALVVVGGSGLAEVLVDAGRAVGLERLDPPLPRAWELAAAEVEGSGAAQSAEDRLAPGRLNARWSRGGDHPTFDQAAACGDAQALAFRARVTLDLAQHVGRRVAELAAHPGATFPERVVLAGALGRMLAREPAWFAELERTMAAELARLGEPRSVHLSLSELRAAPALGAVGLRLFGAGEGAR